MALATLETALRELMGFVNRRRHGPDWLEVVTSEKQRAFCAARAETEQVRTQRGLRRHPPSTVRCAPTPRRRATSCRSDRRGSLSPTPTGEVAVFLGVVGNVESPSALARPQIAVPAK